MKFTTQSLRQLTRAINSKRCQLLQINMGDCCTDLEKTPDGMEALWQLRNLCSRKFIDFQETVTDSFIKKKGGHVLRKACIEGWEGIVRECLEYEYHDEKAKKTIYLDINEQSRTLATLGMTALMWATREAHYTPTRQLIFHKKIKCEINLIDGNGQNALIHAVTQRIIDEEIVRLLVTQGIDVNVKDKNGRSALSYLAEKGGRYGITSTIVLLATSGNKLDVNAPDKKNKTPLMY